MYAQTFFRNKPISDTHSVSDSFQSTLTIDLNVDTIEESIAMKLDKCVRSNWRIIKK